MELLDLKTELQSNSYPGRGIIIGRSDDGKKAVIAYFIMGRSESSRNRVFEKTETGLRTVVFDTSKMTNPSLEIYNAVKVLGNKTIVTNGDQTDTVYDLMNRQFTFEQALRTREFEPDKPNYTPRISGIVRMESDDFNYALSILKSGDLCPKGKGCADSVYRFNFAYNNPCAGEGHFIHTYQGNGEPLPSFEGEPKRVKISGDIDAFSNTVWESLNEENKVSLFVRYIEIKTGAHKDRIINKNE